jgi:RHS repeat-associated protein
MDMQYNYTAGQNNGRIASSQDYISGETVQYAYDGLLRLASAQTTGTQWGEAYTYDGFGNLTGKTPTQGSAPALSVSYNPATNQPYNGNYDANGNAPVGTWNVENKLVGQVLDGTQVNWSYDPFGQRVARYTSSGSWWSEWDGHWDFYLYGPTGQRMAQIGCDTISGQQIGGSSWCVSEGTDVYFGGKLIAETDASGQVLAPTDRLGTVRGVNTSGTIAQPTYFPYGEPKTAGGIDRQQQFGTYVRDSTPSAQDYAGQRYYSNVVARFYSPDPGGIATANPKNPGSWNRYAYVNGDPVNFKDPSGQDCISVFEDAEGRSGRTEMAGGPCSVAQGEAEGGPVSLYLCASSDDGLGFLPSPFCATPAAVPATPVAPPPDCNSITAAVGFTGLTYANASEIWTAGNLSAYGTDAAAATIAALAAVTWQGESGLATNPLNNGNANAQGVVWSVDYGPFQINPYFHPNSNSSVFGTSGAGQVFNGSPAANIAFGMQILEGLYNQFGNNAAGRYVGSLTRNPLAKKREDQWNAWSAQLTGLFSDTDCFPHP